MTNPPRDPTALVRACFRLHRAGAIGILLALLLALVPAASSGLAQAGPSIERLDVSLWPEYDQPSVLVIYRVTLSAESALPARISLPIPAASGEPNAVATGAAWDALFDADYTRDEDGGWATVTVDVDQPLVQVEFYEDITLSDARRDYTFTWPGGFDLGSLSYHVQTPFGASDLAVTPPGTTRAGDDGLIYIDGSLGPQPASTSVEITISYSKATPGLTIDVLQPTGPLAPSGSEGGLSAELTRWLPWAAGALGLVLVVGGALVYWRMNKAPAERRARPRRRPERGLKQGAGEIDASAVFCHVCGTQAAVSDRFCRRCGTRLRQ